MINEKDYTKSNDNRRNEYLVVGILATLVLFVIISISVLIYFNYDSINDKLETFILKQEQDSLTSEVTTELAEDTEEIEESTLYEDIQINYEITLNGVGC